MQEDKRGTDGKNKYVPCNFIVVRCAGKHTRIWEMPEAKNIIVDASKTKDVKAMYDKGDIRREVTCKIDLAPFENKSYGYYIIIPFTMEESASKKAGTRRLFWLRVFSNEEINIEQVKETQMVEEKGEWTEKKPCGPMYLLNQDSEIKDPSLKHYKFNPYWCQNPQYFLNITQPTHLKIILRKEATKKKDNVQIGLSICKHFETQEVQVETRKQTTTRNHVITDQTAKLLMQTSDYLEPPKLEKIERKLLVGPHEDYYESSFKNKDLAALYFHFLPIHGPLVIMPCLSEKNKNYAYNLRIYSDKKISIHRLDESKNSCLVGAWETSTAGGCDMYTEKFYKQPDMQSWDKNPKYLLTFESVETANVKITLAIADRNWRGKVGAQKKKKQLAEQELEKQMKQNNDTKNRLSKNDKEDESANLSVATMISIYILKKKPNVQTEDILHKAPFVPNLQTELSYTFKNMAEEGLEYYIMPATYHKGIEGQFLISVHSDQKFSLK